MEPGKTGKRSLIRRDIKDSAKQSKNEKQIPYERSAFADDSDEEKS